ncbi:hypothetical protein E4K73_43875 [Streptomyces sp. IB201691-2A2]|nr:hypothetical protein E4K73_43875 [Streptomyces sp. IB201691-2A2]
MNVVSTAEVPAGERFGFWREVNAKLWVPYELRCDPELSPGSSNFANAPRRAGAFMVRGSAATTRRRPLLVSAVHGSTSVSCQVPSWQPVFLARSNALSSRA